jgi:hypothetical protein
VEVVALVVLAEVPKTHLGALFRTRELEASLADLRLGTLLDQQL